MSEGAASLPPLLTPGDLYAFAAIDGPKAEAMIADAIAMAKLAAPCISNDDFAHRDAAKAIIRGAVLRWHESGSGAVATHSAGPYSQTLDTRQQRRGMYWPSEIEQLQQLCAATTSGGAFSVDTATEVGGGHSPWCNLMFGAGYCSCGADIGGGTPLYEAGVTIDN